MNTKIIYTILAVVAVAIFGYYFINNQTPDSQLPINNSNTYKVPNEPVLNEPDDPSSLVSGDGYRTYTSDAYGFSIDYPKDWYRSVNKYSVSLSLASPERQSALDVGTINRVCDICIKVYNSAEELPNNQDSKLNFEDWISQLSEQYGFIDRTVSILDGVSGYQSLGMGNGRRIYVMFVFQPQPLE